jgi:hypothetical protein
MTAKSTWAALQNPVLRELWIVEAGMPFSHDKTLNREHDQFLSVTVAVYLGGGLFFLLALPLILRFECQFEGLTKLGLVEFSLWLGALLYSAHCAKSRKAVFRLLDQWEQSLLLRKKNLEALVAYREGQILYKAGAHRILRPVEKRDRVLVTNGKECIASRPD